MATTLGVGSSRAIQTSVLADGRTLLLTADANVTINEGAGNFLVADFGNNATITIGPGNSDVFALGTSNTITTGAGATVIMAGAGSRITTGGNSGGTVANSFVDPTQTVINAASNSTINAGAGNNTIFLNGQNETVTTNAPASTTAIYSLETGGGNTINFGKGANFAFLDGTANVVHDGPQTDILYFRAAGQTIAPNVAGGTEEIVGFTNTDRIDLTAILPAVRSSVLLFSNVHVSVFGNPNIAGGADTVVQIANPSSGAQATMFLFGYNGQSLSAMENAGVFKLA